MPRQDPYRQFRFRVDVGDIQAGFSECTFADTSTDPVEYREGNELPVFRKLSGLTKFGNITLKWGITGDSINLYKWRKTIIDTGAEGARKTVLITLIDEAGQDQAQWQIDRAWPIKYDPPDFSAKGSEVAIETLEIVHEGFTRLK